MEDATRAGRAWCTPTVSMQLSDLTWRYAPYWRGDGRTSTNQQPKAQCMRVGSGTRKAEPVRVVSSMYQATSLALFSPFAVRSGKATPRASSNFQTRPCGAVHSSEIKSVSLCPSLWTLGAVPVLITCAGQPLRPAP